MKRSIYYIRFSSLILLLFFISCKDDEDVKIADGSNQTINSWIYDTMKEVYYWTDYIPGQVNKELSPEAFFEGLRYQADDFSIIVPDYQELVDALEGVTEEAGYEFSFFYVEGGTDELIALVSYVKPNSPASIAGLKRGDLISRINGNQITRSNVNSLYGNFFSNHTLSFSRITEGTTTYEPQPEISLNVIEIQENPNYLDTVYTIDGHVIGYYVYNFFSNGITASNEYDQQMDDIFASFKSEGITDLILDLRYNSGGSISSALNLASLIGRGVSPEDIFYENRWNDFYMDYIEGLENGDEILRGRFLPKAQNIGNNLNGTTIYVLTGTSSASASELIINGLKPYMNVVLIGDRTVGKNVGSIAIEDEDNSLNNYGLLPIAFQVYNSLGQSDYGNGFAPDIVVEDFAKPMRALGDVNEWLLATAISEITGTAPNPGRFGSTRIENVEVISSIDKKVRSNRLIINSETLD